MVGVTDKPDKPDQPLVTDFRQRISAGYRHKKHAAILNDRAGADRAGSASDRAGAGGAGLVSGSVDVPGDRETGLARSASSRCCPPSPTHPAGMVNELLVQTKSSVNACSEIQEAIEWREIWKESETLTAERYGKNLTERANWYSAFGAKLGVKMMRAGAMVGNSRWTSSISPCDTHSKPKPASQERTSRSTIGFQ